MTDGGPRGKIYVVAVPIGNLEDITLRARRILAEVEVIAAEDTRVARKLLGLLGIAAKKIISYHDIGEEKQAQQLVAMVEREQLQLALISDAGTPCIADPGYRLVALAKEKGIAVSPLPGPCSMAALVSAAGLPSDRFLFIGFLPSRAGQLRQECARWGALGCSVVAFESAQRLEKSLGLIAELYPRSRIAIGRELTKVFEEIVTLPIAEALLWWKQHEFKKGELVLMIYPEVEEVPRDQLEAEIAKEAVYMLAQGASQRDLLEHFKDRGLTRKELYQVLLKVRE
jgi:16S rRNA (cytidine1402-2'-O)-methyltransferase